MDLAAFVAKWAESSASERANKDAFLLELCDVLGVPRPDAATGDRDRDHYVFERDAVVSHEGGKLTVGKIDLYKEGCFLLEAKQGSEAGDRRVGTARRNTPAWNIAMRDAYGQALGYARTFDQPPPFLVICDIGHCFDVYSAFDGSGDYRPFPDAQSSRLHLADLAKHVESLRAVFVDPLSLDPSTRAAKVTREVAGHLADLARELEDAGYAPELVAKFLMRCLFTMFAEDVGLLPERIFTDALEREWLPNPEKFPLGMQSLWAAMNEGLFFGFVGKLLRFNGGLFSEQGTLPLTKLHLELLLEAARCNWAEVEPAIFGTLLERALDARERHALGAHYTPRAYVERLVKPTIEEPIRAEWAIVQAEARQLVNAGKVKQADKVVRSFHDRLCRIRVLDPACGSGNFLYVTLDLFKRLEDEVLKFVSDLSDSTMMLEGDAITVTPAQFHGIEIKRWAKEITELVLWIGYLQWHHRTHGRVPPREPVLQDYRNIEFRDAVLAYDREEIVRDEHGRPVTRWDGHTMKKSLVTGEDVPDESALELQKRFVNPRRAMWPDADFIIGNPPFVGNKRMRSVLGDGYVDALRAAHDDVPETSDYVMYWWNHAATLVHAGKLRRFGLITTNSITQTFNRGVVQRHLESKDSLAIAFAIPDHPWVDCETGAAVRIAMTVGEAGSHAGRLLEVIGESDSGEDHVDVLFAARIGQIHPDLSVGPDVIGARALDSNERLSYQGPILVGEGFRLTVEDLGALGLDREEVA